MMKCEEKFKAVLASAFGIQMAEVRDDMSTETFNEWDSLKQMNIIVALEEEFDIGFDEVESILLKDYKTLYQTVKLKLGKLS